MKTKNIEERFNSVAEKYDAQRKSAIPFMNEFYSTGIQLLAGERSFGTILDLGAGTGLLAGLLLRTFPDASFSLVDVSADMLAVARRKFAKQPNFHFFNEDYTRRLPGGKYDLVASALSIHHLPDGEKARLYRRVYSSLEKGGWFLNLDQYNGEDRFMNGMYIRAWECYMKQSGLSGVELRKAALRRKLDRETTILRELAGLKRAGFRECGCVFQYLKFGAIVAKK